MTPLRQLLRHGRLPLVWAAALLTLSILGFFRTLTDAEFALASAAIIPVYVVAWTGGFRHGLIATLFAAMMWFVSGWLISPASGPHWIVLLNGMTQFLVYLCVAALTARVRTLLLHEAESARREALTGLLNRRAFHEMGHYEVLRAARYRHPVAIVFIDLNHFKRLNDSRGHEAGHQPLCAVARALSGALRTTDHLARLGGDEFGVLLPEIDQTGVAVAAEKLQTELAAVLIAYPPVSASVGIAWFEYAGADFGAMLREADALMYEIKREGDGGVCLRHFSDPALAADLSSPMEV